LEHAPLQHGAKNMPKPCGGRFTQVLEGNQACGQEMMQILASLSGRQADMTFMIYIQTTTYNRKFRFGHRKSTFHPNKLDQT